MAPLPQQLARIEYHQVLFYQPIFTKILMVFKPYIILTTFESLFFHMRSNLMLQTPLREYGLQSGCQKYEFNIIIIFRYIEADFIK
jgi:hypothetical protein